VAVAEESTAWGAREPVRSGMGFGWSFYGFFVAAAVWLALYFVWAWRAAVRDRLRQGR
jgi:hypothetical protein